MVDCIFFCRPTEKSGGVKKVIISGDLLQVHTGCLPVSAPIRCGSHQRYICGPPFTSPTAYTQGWRALTSIINYNGNDVRVF